MLDGWRQTPALCRYQTDTDDGTKDGSGQDAVLSGTPQDEPGPARRHPHRAMQPGVPDGVADPMRPERRHVGKARFVVHDPVVDVPHPPAGACRWPGQRLLLAAHEEPGIVAPRLQVGAAADDDRTSHEAHDHGTGY